jgi:hypothetical protein
MKVVLDIDAPNPRAAMRTLRMLLRRLLRDHGLRVTALAPCDGEQAGNGGGDDRHT